jgi:hypothetical protein
MQSYLVRHVKTKLNNMAADVIGNYPCDLSPVEIYEDLIREPHVLAAFAEAGKYLSPTGLTYRTTAQMDGRRLGITLSLPSCDKYSCYPMPKFELKIAAGSKLHKHLKPQVQIAEDWANLICAFSHLGPFVTDMRVLAFLMPWVPPLVSDAPIEQFKRIMDRKTASHVKAELKQLSSGRLPDYCPSLPTLIGHVCLSGKRLITQHHLLMTGERRHPAHVALEHGESFVTAEVRNGIDEAISNNLALLDRHIVT